MPLFNSVAEEFISECRMDAAHAFDMIQDGEWSRDSAREETGKMALRLSHVYGRKMEDFAQLAGALLDIRLAEARLLATPLNVDASETAQELGRLTVLIADLSR